MTIKEKVMQAWAQDRKVDIDCENGGGIGMITGFNGDRFTVKFDREPAIMYRGYESVSDIRFFDGEGGHVKTRDEIFKVLQEALASGNYVTITYKAPLQHTITLSGPVRVISIALAKDYEERDYIITLDDKPRISGVIYFSEVFDAVATGDLDGHDLASQRWHYDPVANVITCDDGELGENLVKAFKTATPAQMELMAGAAELADLGRKLLNSFSGWKHETYPDGFRELMEKLRDLGIRNVALWHTSGDKQ